MKLILATKPRKIEKNSSELHLIFSAKLVFMTSDVGEASKRAKKRAFGGDERVYFAYIQHVTL